MSISASFLRTEQPVSSLGAGEDDMSEGDTRRIMDSNF